MGKITENIGYEPTHGTLIVRRKALIGLGVIVGIPTLSFLATFFGQREAVETVGSLGLDGVEDFRGFVDIAADKIGDGVVVGANAANQGKEALQGVGLDGAELIGVLLLGWAAKKAWNKWGGGVKNESNRLYQSYKFRKNHRMKPVKIK